MSIHKTKKLLPIHTNATEQSQELHNSIVAFALFIVILVSSLVLVVSLFSDHFVTLISSFAIAVTSTTLWLIKEKYPRAVTRIFIATIITAGIVAILSGLGIHDIGILLFPIAILFGSIHFSLAFYVVATVIIMITMTATGIVYLDLSFAIQSEKDAYADILIADMIIIAFSVFTWKMTQVYSTLLTRLETEGNNFNTLFNASNSGTLLYDIKSDAIIDSNATFNTMFGIETHGSLPPSPISLLSDQTRKSRLDLYRRSRRALLGKKQVFHCDVKQVDGTPFWAEISLQKITLQNQDYLMAEVGDITQKKSVEKELLQSEKLAAIGQLAGGIAHDFNNQLAGILGTSTLLIEELTDPEEIKLLQTVITSANKASQLTKQVLSYARKGSLTNESIDLNAMIEEVKELLSRTIDKRITLSVELQEDLPLFVGDGSLLQNMFLNLGINSRDALEDGGFITYRTQLTHLSEAQAQDLTVPTAEGTYFHITVSDTGSGIPPEVQEKMFDPFFTTKPQGVGTGMGLSAILGTTLEYKGGINVESLQSHGTDIHLYLPFDETKTATLPTPTMALPPLDTPTHSKGSFLIVDDEPVIRSTLDLMLKRLGHKAEAVESGKEALKALTDGIADNTPFDVILLDMILADSRGYDIAQELHIISPATPIVIISGYSVGSDLEKTLALEGVYGFLSKPFHTSELAAAITPLLDHK